MRSLGIRLAGLVTLTLALTGCASSEVRSYTARGVDLLQPRTYNWARDDARATGDPRLDNNRFFEEHVRAAVDEQLANKGFAKAESPDVIVHYHASVIQDVKNRGVEPGGDCKECAPDVYDQATLLIDLVDAHTDQLVWRGWAKGHIDGVVDDQQWMERRIDEVVARIMRELPARAREASE